MKNTIILFISIFLLSLINSTNVQAEQGTCIIQQFSNTYEIDLPFYWYKVTKIEKTDSMLHNSISYTHTSTYVDTSTKCNNINNSLPKRENDNLNILNYAITTFYFSKNPLTISETIYNEGIATFKHTPSNEDLRIKTTFLSLDNLPPVISNETLSPTIITSLEEVINIIYLKTKLTAYDEIDGIVEIKVHEDNYTKNSKTVGSHTVTFSATDSSNNTSYLTITIVVKDTTKPIITGNSNLTSNMSNPLTIQQIKDSLSVEDNYYEISNSFITVHTDNYTGNEQKEGLFTVSFKVRDLSNNISNAFIVTISTYDDIPPEINGESYYETNYKTLLDLNSLSNNLIVKDNIDDYPKIELLNDNYSNQHFKIGIHKIFFYAIDKNGNKSSPFGISINVKDLTSPTIYISQKFIGIDNNSNIDIKDIIEIIETNNNISTNNLLSFEIVKDEYTPNKTIPGEYLVELNYEYENGEEINIETKIIIDSFNSKESKEQPKNTPKQTFWSVLKDFFLKIWNFVKYIFSFDWLKKLI